MRQIFQHGEGETRIFLALASDDDNRAGCARENVIGLKHASSMHPHRQRRDGDDRGKPQLRKSNAMNTPTDTSSVQLPVSLSGAKGSLLTRSNNGLLAGTLTVPCPMTGARVLLQRCAFCARSEGLFLDPTDGSLNLRCRVTEPEG